MSKCDVRGEPREAVAFDKAGAGQAEVFIDDDDLLRRPARAVALAAKAYWRCVDSRLCST